MTHTENDLRAALALEQQADRITLPTPGKVTRTRASRRWLLPVAYALAVLIVAVTAAALIWTPSGDSDRAANPAAPTVGRNPASTGCLHTATPRPGADRVMVPAAPVSLTICQYPDGHRAVTQTTNIAAIVNALDTVATEPIEPGCRARSAGAAPAEGTYELHFHYRTGPDVIVNVLPQCRPSVNNSTGLQADDADTVVAALNAALAARSTPEHSATLTIRVALFGGPANAEGRAVDSDTPQPQAQITVRGPHGDLHRAATDQQGTATLALPAGRYGYTSDTCGTGDSRTRHVTLRPGATSHVQIDCDVP